MSGIGINAYKLQSAIQTHVKQNQEVKKRRSRQEKTILIRNQESTPLHKRSPEQLDIESQQAKHRAQLQKNVKKVNYQSPISKNFICMYRPAHQTSLSHSLRYQKVNLNIRLSELDKIRVDQHDQMKAIDTLKNIMRKKQIQNEIKIPKHMHSNSSSHLLTPFQSQPKIVYLNNTKNEEKPEQHSSFREQLNQLPDNAKEKDKAKDKEKHQINFLKGLNQNKNLPGTSMVEEYYQDGKVIVNMKSRDFLTFIRLQHEVDELKRKQDDFNEQKERHFNIAREEVKFSSKRKPKFVQLVGSTVQKQGARISKKSYTEINQNEKEKEAKDMVVALQSPSMLELQRQSSSVQNIDDTKQSY